MTGGDPEPGEVGVRMGSARVGTRPRTPVLKAGAWTWYHALRSPGHSRVARKGMLEM